MLGIKPISRNKNNNVTSPFQEYEHIKFPVMLLRQKSDRTFLCASSPTRKLAVCIQTIMGEAGDGMVGRYLLSFRGCL